jgi:hypothetical protein
MRTIRTAKRRDIVLDAIAEGLTVGEAARRAGISRRAVFEWKAADPEFARDYEVAFEAGTDSYEAEARRRGFNGSDALLIFMLKCRDPQRFNRRMIAIGGDPDAPPVAVTSGAWIYPRAEMQREMPIIEAEAEDVAMIEADEIEEEEAA